MIQVDRLTNISADLFGGPPDFRGVFTPRSDIPPEAETILDGTCSYAESAAHERAKGRYNVSGRARDTHTLRGGGALAGPAPLHTHIQAHRALHTPY